MRERELLHIKHKDGTLTILGVKNQSFEALESPLQPVSKADVESRIKKAPIPFKDNAETIVGWGGFSVAARLGNSLSPDSSREVVIFRPLSTEDDIDQAGLNWKNEQVVNKQFIPFTIPQHLVIVNGIEGRPTVLKVAKEVEGATFKDFSLLTVLGGPSVLEQYVEFCQKTLMVFLSEGKLVDTSGHLARNKLRQLLIGMVPFYSSNLMVEYGSNKLIFVDCDVKPAIHFFQKADRLQKIGMLVRAGFIGTTAVAAKAFILAHHARNRFLEENHTKTNIDRIRHNEEYQNFTFGVQEIVQTLNNAEVNYRVIGSIGLAGTIQSAGGEFYLTPTRVNKTRRDIDIIVLDHDSEKIERLTEYLRKRSQTIRGYPAISLVAPIRIDQPTHKDRYPHDRILPTEITRVGIDKDGNIYQVYKDLTSVISRQWLEPVVVEYEGIRLPTVHPGVLAGFYLTRGGSFKSKDRKKIETIFAYTKFHIPSVFRDFAHVIRNTYPGFYNNFLVREWFSYWSGGFISGGQITKFFDYFESHLSRVKPKRGLKETESAGVKF